MNSLIFGNEVQVWGENEMLSAALLSAFDVKIHVLFRLLCKLPKQMETNLDSFAGACGDRIGKMNNIGVHTGAIQDYVIKQFLDNSLIFRKH